MNISFTIEGEPVPKARPRFTQRGGYVSTYSTSKTVEAERRVAAAYMEHGDGVIEGPVGLICEFYMGIPKSDSKATKAKKKNGEILPLKKPDIDNLVKLVMDGLNGLAFADDCQVAWIRASKMYSTDPRTEVVICR